MSQISLLSPAKVNLTFEILGRLDNGYHNIRSIIQPINIFDEVKIRLSEGKGIELRSKGIKIPDDESNLAFKAAALYLKKSGTRKKISIQINKKIPVGSGLGGGSANAAAVLVGLNRILNFFSENVLYKLAPELGADVSVFIRPTTSLVEGIGEKITPLIDFPLFHYVVVYPKLQVLTKDVYEKWDELNPVPVDTSLNTNIDKIIESFSSLEKRFELKNDLEIPAFKLHPELKSLKDLMKSFKAESVLMSGSGSSVFAIFNEQELAKDLFDYLSTNSKFESFLATGINSWHRLVD